ncbi:MAG TPA: nitroreductase/quinone reductase family protein, partial [Thermomicrobiaceae bacterium]|nr:nitroreductase/quinone reductase family protein [Thermomicrobiaceae bacterium]
MGGSPHADPAERSPIARLFYRDWRPTRFGRWVNQLEGRWAALGLPPKAMAALEVRGRTSGRTRSTAVAIATVDGQSYLVSMLGRRSEWVRNVEAASGDAVLRHG